MELVSKPQVLECINKREFNRKDNLPLKKSEPYKQYLKGKREYNLTPTS
jgi:hypothetical protein